MRGLLPRAPRPSPASPPDLAAALAHPLRARIALALAGDEALPVRGLAEALGEAPRRVRYHADRLRRAGFLEAVWEGEEPRRPRRYRLAVDLLPGDDHRVGPGPLPLGPFTVELFRRIVQDVSRAFVSEEFYARPEFCTMRVSVPVDARGWEEIVAASRVAVERIERARRAAAERLERSGEKPIAAAAAILWFESARH